MGISTTANSRSSAPFRQDSETAGIEPANTMARTANGDAGASAKANAKANGNLAHSMEGQRVFGSKATPSQITKARMKSSKVEGSRAAGSRAEASKAGFGTGAALQEKSGGPRRDGGLSSKFKGVSWDQMHRLWQVTITTFGNKRFLGYFRGT